MIILKFTKKQGFTLSLKDTFFEKLQGEGNIFTPKTNAKGKPHDVILRHHNNTATYGNKSLTALQHKIWSKLPANIISKYKIQILEFFGQITRENKKVCIFCSKQWYAKIKFLETIHRKKLLKRKLMK